MGKAKEPPPEPPPPPVKQVVQVHCVPWKVMDFQIEVQLPYLTIAQLEGMIKTRHGDPISNLVLYTDDLSKENMLEPGSTKPLPGTKFFYDYYPPLDPFKNRPTASQIYNQNPLMKTKCEEIFEGKPGEPGSAWVTTPEAPVTVIGEVRPWSKTAEHDPLTQRLMDEEAARVKAEAEAKAKAEAERIAEEKRIAAEKAAEKKRIAAEKAAKKKAEEEEEARQAAEAEAARLKKLEEEAMNDPVKRAEFERKKAEAEAAAKKAEAEAKLASLPKRVKGGAVGIFLGGTTKEYYGLDKCTAEDPMMSIPCEKMLAEIVDKGKISDLYNSKALIEAYKGADGEMLFCKDEEELYGDNGFIICLHEADKEHFLAHWGAGNGIPPEIK